MVKTPKLYFCDTGLAAYLAGWSSAKVLANGAVMGHYFENYVVGEFARAYACSSKGARLFFYRDSNQKEIDLVIEAEGELHPVEIKLAGNPDSRLTRTFKVLEGGSMSLGRGAVVCMTDCVMPLDSANAMVPCRLV